MKHTSRCSSIALCAMLAFASGLTAPAFAEAELPGKGKTVQPARPNWDSFWFGQKIVDIGLERLGYTVRNPMTLGSTAIFTSMAQNDIQYSVDTILPNHSAYYEETKDDVMPVGPIMDPGTVQGYMVDKKTAEEYDIRYLEDLRKPEIARLFDQNGDGKADMIGPSAGWAGSSAVATKHLQDLELGDTVYMVQGEYTALAADAVGRYASGDPIFLYTWYPNPTTMKLKPGEDLLWLELQNITLPDDQMDRYQPLEGVDGCRSDPCNVGWLPTVYYIGVNREWAAENPAAIEFFRQFKMTLQDRAEQNIKMLNGEGREEDIARHAEAWIAAHEEDFNVWLEAARQAAQ
ncbi:MAG: glycine betaine/L-proline ABC transporter substrate-binding protein ProX [Aliihoeflea sp.]